MSTMTPSRVKDLRQRVEAKRLDVEGMSKSWKTEDGGEFVLSTDEFTKYRTGVNELKQLTDLLTLEQTAAGIFERLDLPAGSTVGGDDAVATQRGQFARKSLGASVLESKTFGQLKDGGWTQSGRLVDVEAGIPELSALSEAKDIYSSMAGNLPGMPVLGTAQNIGWTSRTLREGRVRDLFQVERTNAAMLYGVREVGFVNRARVVRQRTAADGVSDPTGGPTDVFGLKPRSDIQIKAVQFPIATIAHIMNIHKNTLDDEPRLRGIIDRDLVDGVKMVEDEQILFGNGEDESLVGIMNTPGVQEYVGLATDKRSAQLRRAITRAALAYQAPTGVALSPGDWEHIELETDLQGAYTVALSVAVGGEKRVWRLNVIDTPAMSEGQFLMGAFASGAAKLYDREQVNVQLSTENRDHFERNVYTLRGEERVGLAVERPEAFVIGTLTEPTAA